MKDTEDPFHAFAFIDSMLSRLGSSDDGVVFFHSAVMSRVPDLVQLNRLFFFCSASTQMPTITNWSCIMLGPVIFLFFFVNIVA